jgi:hypothetical protein
MPVNAGVESKLIPWGDSVSLSKYRYDYLLSSFATIGLWALCLDIITASPPFHLL